jgi:hypothetical protein
LNKKNLYLLFTFFLLFLSQSILADKRIARISENFGRTNIYGGQGINYYIVGSINSEDLFYCEESKNDWYKITALKWTEKGEQIEGYVLKDLVEFIDQLPEQSKKELLLVTFERQIEMSYKVQRSDSLSKKTAVLAMEKYCRTKYLPVVSLFPDYFCKTRDSVALSFFMESMIADNGSTSNMTYVYLTECYLCNPEVLLQQLNVISRKNQRLLIIDNVVRGLKNVFKVQDIVFEKPEAQAKKNYVEFSRLVKKLEVVSQ